MKGNLSIPARHASRIRGTIKSLREAIEANSPSPTVLSRLEALEETYRKKMGRILYRYNRAVRHRDALIEKLYERNPKENKS